jgi:hypothetical protein
MNMKKQLRLTAITLFSIVVSTVSNAQNNPIEKNPPNTSQNLTISIEFRPRTELRRGYRSLPSDSCNVAFFTSHRASINLDYRRKNFIFHTSLQDVRVWGDTDPRDAGGKAQFYEFYAEPSFNEQFSVRIGRQRIKYDNQRLFAENNWRQAGGKHDAVRFIYSNKKLSVDLIGAYNQTKENEFGTSYDIAWDNYRSLVANFIKYQLTPKIALTAINYGDEYTDPSTGNIIGHWKFTDGGRIEYNNKRLILTFAGYYQHAEMANFFLSDGDKYWKNTTSQVRVFTRSDAAGAAVTWAKYLGGEGQETLKGIAVYGDPALAEAVKTDPNAIGFNNVIYVYDLKSGNKYPGLEVAPIDVNENGSIDPEEDFYHNIDEITAAIEDGRYPSPPARELFLISKGAPTKPVVNIFLQWVLNKGQGFIEENGYIVLSEQIISAQKEKF